jgi:hypothetical protein
MRPRGSRHLLVRVTAAFTAVWLAAGPLAANAATWTGARGKCHGSARKLGCHDRVAAIPAAVRASDAGQQERAAAEAAKPPARKPGCHDHVPSAGAVAPSASGDEPARATGNVGQRKVTADARTEPSAGDATADGGAGRRIGDLAAQSGAKHACCCNKTPAISSTHCGCRHDGPPVMTHDSAVPPAVALLGAAQPHAPLSAADPHSLEGLPLAPPDPPPRG